MPGLGTKKTKDSHDGILGKKGKYHAIKAENNYKVEKVIKE
jgi:hypothetical protein